MSNFKCVRVKKVLLSTSSKHSMNYKQETTILKAYHRHHHLTIHNFPRRLTITGILISFRGFNVITVTISYQGNIYIFVGLRNFLVHFHSRKYNFFLLVLRNFSVGFSLWIAESIFHNRLVERSRSTVNYCLLFITTTCVKQILELALKGDINGWWRSFLYIGLLEYVPYVFH